MLLKKTTLICLFLINSSLYANLVQIRKDVKHVSFEQAANHTEKVFFKIKSTTIGLFTSAVAGHVLAYKATAGLDLKLNEVSNMQILFNVTDLRTDNDSRDEKLWEDCLNFKQNPELGVSIQAPVKIDDTEKEVQARMWIRGKEFFITIRLQLASKGNVITVKGQTNLSIKHLEIPDPSILFAKVDDTIEVNFNFEMTK